MQTIKYLILPYESRPDQYNNFGENVQKAIKFFEEYKVITEKLRKVHVTNGTKCNKRVLNVENHMHQKV
jgi:hypothetical protein